MTNRYRPVPFLVALLVSGSVFSADFQRGDESYNTCGAASLDNLWSTPSEEAGDQLSESTQKLAITSHPANQTAPVGEKITFHVQAQGGTPPYTYAWYWNGCDVKCNSESFCFTLRSKDNNAKIHAMVQDSDGNTETSRQAIITLGNNPTPDEPAPEQPPAADGVLEPNMSRVKSTLSFFCSDECNGRNTGSPGERLAGNHIAKFFQSQGLAPIKNGGSPTAYHMAWSYKGASFASEDDGTPGANAWWSSEDVSRAGEAYNIACVIPGSDPKLKNEYIVLTAHYDHIGKSKGGICRGADDNASGTAGLMEVAYCLKNAKPRRSIICVAVSGEEKGLLGSKAFVANCPVNISAIKGNINLDMIGRNTDEELHITPAKTNGKVSSLAKDSRNISQKYGITLSAGIEMHINSSDHASFMKKGIPCVFFNSGLHNDYHTPKDTVDKLNFNKMQKVIQIARDLTLKAANDASAPTILEKSEWSAWKWGKFSSKKLRNPRPIIEVSPTETMEAE